MLNGKLSKKWCSNQYWKQNAAKNICFSGLFYHTILYYLLVTMHNNQWTIFSHLSFSYLQVKDTDHLVLDFELTYSKNIQSILKYTDKLQLFKWLFIGNVKQEVVVPGKNVKTWPLAVIKLMWSLCLNPFQEAWCEDKEKEEGFKSNPCCGQRAKAMHGIDAKKAPCQVVPHPAEAESRAGRWNILTGLPWSNQYTM